MRIRCQRPDTNCVAAPAEEIPHMTYLAEATVLGEDVPHLIHRGTPAESLVQVIEAFDRVTLPVILKVVAHSFA